MKNEIRAFETRTQRLHRRTRAERLLLHPATITATAVLGVALVGLPLTLASARASGEAAARLSASSAKAARVLADERASTAAASGGGQAAGTKRGPAAAAAIVTETAPAKAAAGAPQATHKTKLIAFYADWGDEGYRSLARNIDQIDVLIPMWYHLGNDGRVRSGNPKAEARVMRLIRDRNPDMKVMPIVNNYDKRTESWNPEQIDARMKNPAERKRMAIRIVQAMKSKGFDGVNIDFEGFEPRSRARIVAFMGELYPRAKRAGLEVSQDVIVGSKTYDHKKLSRRVDYLIPMMYDEHWKTSGPGPIASQGWYDKTLRKFVKLVGAKKVVVGMGTYAYDWGRPGVRAKALTHREATTLARRLGKEITLHPSKKNSTFRYRRRGVSRQVWMLDAASAHNQVRTASKLGVRGYAIWRIGAEDPALWKVLPRRDDLGPDVAESLNTDRRYVERDSDTGLLVDHRISP